MKSRQKPNVLSFSSWQSTGKYLKHVNVNEMWVILKRHQYSRQYSNVPNARFYTRVGTPKYLITKPIENQVKIVTTLVTRIKSSRHESHAINEKVLFFMSCPLHRFYESLFWGLLERNLAYRYPEGLKLLIWNWFLLFYRFLSRSAQVHCKSQGHPTRI